MLLIKTIQWLRSNLGSLILALVLALTVWVTANQEVNPVEEGDLGSPIRITVKGLEPGLIITNNYTETARVRLRAQRQTWRSLSAEDVQITADLSGLGPGSHQVALTIEINAQAVLISANPASIRVDIEEEYERILPIQLSIRGQPAIGYIDGEPEVKPATVLIRGPRPAVELVSEVRIEASIEGLRETFRDDLAVVALDSNENRVTGITIVPAEVGVTIPIRQEAGYREVAVSVPIVGRPAVGYYPTSVIVTPPLITVRGDPAVIESMQPYIQTQPIDLSGLTDDLLVKVPLNLPAGVTAIDTQVVEVFISIAAQMGSRALFIPIQVNGLAEGLEAELKPEELEVILSGPLPILDALDIGQEVLVTVNVEGLSPGTYQLDPTVQVTQRDILVETFFPLIVEVRISAERAPGSR